MITLRCTKKLQNFLGVQLVEIPEKSTAALGDWYANLVPTCIGNLILCISEKSLLTVAIPERESSDLEKLFPARVVNLLLMIGVHPAVIQNEIRHYQQIQYTKTASRSVLGSLNDFSRMFQAEADMAGDGKSSLSLSDAEYKMSETPCSPLDYNNPADETIKLLGTKETENVNAPHEFNAFPGKPNGNDFVLKQINHSQKTILEDDFRESPLPQEPSESNFQEKPKLEFIKGQELCESFFKEIAQPILKKSFPTLRYAAGLIGYGSDVLGFDDAMSTDHMWGPRFLLFLPEERFDRSRAEISAAFSTGFPYEYKGYSTNFSPPDWNDNGVRQREHISEGSVNPLVEYHTLRSYFESYLGWAPFEEITVSQWLTFSEHRLLGITSGRVFHDDLGLEKARKMLGYYPQDVWLWMMASQWKMLAEEEAFTGRCGLVGDETGSRIIAARQVQRIMRLCFLMEKQYAPYSKWFGTAFKQLNIAAELSPVLERVLKTSDWQERDRLLGRAYTIAADTFNSLGLTEKLDSSTREYFDRPFRVLMADRFADALMDAVQKPDLKKLRPPFGSVCQFTDSTTVFDDPALADRLKSLYK